jgi:hypothetical protein
VSTWTVNAPPVVGQVVTLPDPSKTGRWVLSFAGFRDTSWSEGPFRCTVDYGDGSGPEAGYVLLNLCIGPAHRYAAAGSYTVTVSVTDGRGATGAATAGQVVTPSRR